MSADNGIYIAKFDKGYRICHAQAIENLNPHHFNSNNERITAAENYFKESKYYASKDEATLAAHALADKIIQEDGILEYGVTNLGDFTNEKSHPTN